MTTRKPFNPTTATHNDKLMLVKPAPGGEMIDFVTFVGPGKSDGYVVVDNYGIKTEENINNLFSSNR